MTGLSPVALCKGRRAGLSGLFEALELPAPQAGQYYEATGDRCLVFLTDLGLVLRITPNEAVFNKENPHFLKPLFSRQAGNFRLDIDPGLNCPVSYADSDRIYSLLRKNFGIRVSDAKTQNLAYLPTLLPRFPVVIDLDPDYTCIEPPAKPPPQPYITLDSDALGRLEKSVRSVKALLGCLELPLPFTDPQAEFYAPLRSMMNDIWPASQDAPAPGGIARFKEACLNFKRNGKLMSNWSEKRNNYQNTYDAALNYQKKLKAVSNP